MTGAILLFGILAGLDNLQVCSLIGMLPQSRRRMLLLALAFGSCEMIAPLAGLALGHFALAAAGKAATAVGPLMMLLSGGAVLLSALRRYDAVGSFGCLFGLPLTLSLDNLAAGVGLSPLPYSVWAAAAIVGSISAAMSCAGLVFGGWIRGRRILPARVDFAIGIYLCAWGLRMLAVNGMGEWKSFLKV